MNVGLEAIKSKMHLYICLIITIFVFIALLFIFIDNSMESRTIYNAYKANNSLTKYTQRSKVSRQEILEMREEAKAEVTNNEARVNSGALAAGASMNSSGQLVLSSGINLGKPHPSSGFTLPFAMNKIPPHNWSSGKGARWGQQHQGFDIGSGGNRNLYAYAVDAGEVVFIGDSSRSGRGVGYGNSVAVKHSNGLISYYAHGYTPPSFKEGDYLSRGDVIFEIGGTSNSTSDNGSLALHLHFEVYTNWTGSPSGVREVPGKHLLRPENMRTGLGDNTGPSAWPETQPKSE